MANISMATTQFCPPLPGSPPALWDLPRGAITEITGEATSGRTAFAHLALAASTAAGNVVAVVDTSDALDPASARRNGVDLGKLLWVKCGHQLDTQSDRHDPARGRLRSGDARYL